MTIENFKITIHDQLFVLIITCSIERLEAIEKALIAIGAKAVGPHIVAVHKGMTTVDDIKFAIGALEEGECVYVLGAQGDALESHFLIPPRLDGGILVA